MMRRTHLGMDITNRHGRGTKVAGASVGGQFAPITHTQPNGDALGSPMAESEPDWGDPQIQEGSLTPWGKAQHVERIAPGIVAVSTEGHGGVKLSPERNREIPAPLRDRSGWYEEDCEVYIPMATFPEHFANPGDKLNSDLSREEITQRARAGAERGVREWYPDKWEQATGEKVTAEESRVVAEREWRAEHAGSPIVTSAVAADSSSEFVRVTTQVAGSKDEAEYLVPRAEYAERSRLGFVVDPAQHPQLPPRGLQPHDIPKPEAKRYSLAGQLQTVDRMAPRARTAILNDLGQRWRHPETGEVRSLERIIEHEGAVHLQTYFGESGRPTYAVIGRNSASYRISKTTSDFLAAQIPDGTSESEKLHAKADRTNSRYVKLIGDATTVEEVRAANKVQELSQTLKREAAAQAAQEREDHASVHGTWQERAERERQVQIAREQYAIVQHQAGEKA